METRIVGPRPAPRLTQLACLPLLVIAGQPALAQQADAAGSPTIAIQAGRLIDGTGAPPVEDVTILVRGERIVAVGPDVSIPADAEIVDLSEATVLPGLIDMHTHITGDPSFGYADQALHEWPGYDAIIGVKNARETLLAGFTTIRNVGADDFADVALKHAIENGVVPGPRMFVAAYALGITGGHCDQNGFRPDIFDEPGVEQGISNGVDEVRAAVRYQMKYGADLIKFCATGGVLSAGDAVGVQQYTLEEMQAIVETAGFAEAKVAAHAHGNEGIKTAARARVASIEHGSVLDAEAIALMKENGVYLVPTMMAFEAIVQGAEDGTLAPWSAAKALEITPMFQESIRLAIAEGVNIAFGTDSGVYPHGLNADEFRLLVEAGMTPMQAILAATREAAILLGQAEELGSVEGGKRADLVAVRGDPLDDVEILKQVDFVMKDGKVYKENGQPRI